MTSSYFVTDALPVPSQDAEITSWLKPPIKRSSSGRLPGGRYSVHVYDQPALWMPYARLQNLHDALLHVARHTMDEVPTYGMFAGDYQAYRHRIVGVVYDVETNEPAAFTAMVYLPYEAYGRRELVVHLGLTMIAQAHRKRRLQTPLQRRLFTLLLVNQRRLGVTVTNIAASPAGIGAVSDYFQNVFPTYRQDTKQTQVHRRVATQILQNFRHEFGCSQRAQLDPDTFVVRGSNQPEGGGAHQFLRTDPTSQYRVQACNAFCAEQLDFARGDELFQVGEANLLEGLRRSSRRRRAGTTSR